MTGPAGHRRLTLDARARIIASGDALHVLHRRGLFELRGKGLEHLHARLAPVLDGGWTRAQVLVAAGQHAHEVGRYLDRLHEAGVLGEGVHAQEFPTGLPAPCAGVQHLTIGRTRVAVTLCGDEPSENAALRLSFARRATVEQRLLDLEEPQSRAGRIWIVCDGEPRHDELVRRAAVARHLLAMELGRGHEGRVSIFQLASDRCALQRLAVAAWPAMPFDTLPAQLGLVQLLDRPQLPLVAMAADLPGLGRRGIGYGLDAPTITATLTQEVIAREALLHRIDLGTIAGVQGDLFQRVTRRAEVRLTPAAGARALIASSRARCDEAMLLAWALDRSTDDAGRTIDLVTVDAPSTRVAVLQDALRRRRPALPARLDDRLSPLVVVRSPLFAVARVGFEEVLAEALLRAAADTVGLAAPGALACMPSLRPPMRRRLITARMRVAAAPVGVITGQFRFLGTTHFFGVLMCDKEAGS